MSRKEQKEREYQICPYCAEYVKQEAVVCKHCGISLSSGDSDFDIERYRGN